MTVAEGVTHVNQVSLADLLPTQQLMAMTDADVMLTVMVPHGEGRVVVNDGTAGGSRFCMTALHLRFDSEGSWTRHLLPSRHIIVGEVWQFAADREVLIRSVYVVR